MIDVYYYLVLVCCVGVWDFIFRGVYYLIRSVAGTAIAPVMYVPERKVRARQDTVVGNTHRPVGRLVSVYGSGPVPQKIYRLLMILLLMGKGEMVR